MNLTDECSALGHPCRNSCHDGRGFGKTLIRESNDDQHRESLDVGRHQFSKGRRSRSPTDSPDGMESGNCRESKNPFVDCHSE